MSDSSHNVILVYTMLCIAGTEIWYMVSYDEHLKDRGLPRQGDLTAILPLCGRIFFGLYHEGSALTYWK